MYLDASMMALSSEMQTNENRTRLRFMSVPIGSPNGNREDRRGKLDPFPPVSVRGTLFTGRWVPRRINHLRIRKNYGKTPDRRTDGRTDERASKRAASPCAARLARQPAGSIRKEWIPACFRESHRCNEQCKCFVSSLAFHSGLVKGRAVIGEAPQYRRSRHASPERKPLFATYSAPLSSVTRSS